MTITLSHIDTHKEAKSLTLKDTTAYGVPPAAMTLIFRYWTATTTYTLVLNSTQIAALRGAGLVIDPVLLDITDTEGTAFSDGVWQVSASADAGAHTGDLKLLINKTAERCITTAIGKLAASPCDCRDEELKLNMLIRRRFAADVKLDLKDYDGAHNLVVSIGAYCGSNDCNC